ncbi:MAG TPA: MBL fold metallo-hydrolase [Candidatus Cloacimonadota bacterium]|nr:MBL fold metallo-hydrolase [Candidatus Cloacimonadota bacterium]HPK40473.1 MBL fold metallo-hydrolase [Candidatus Cloacimonadota bacterium]
MIRINIISENHVAMSHRKQCIAEWGLSFFLEVEGKNILFDSGHKGFIAQNAEIMGIDLNRVDYVALSHYHWDHLEGLLHFEFAEKKKLFLHPDILTKIPVEQKVYLQEKFAVIESQRAIEISKNVFFLGEIPRVTHFEPGTYKGLPINDDTALAISTDQGVVVITGCSHSGICNICEYAKKVTGQKLYAVIGGFHLKEKDTDIVNSTIDYFTKEKPTYLCPMHCVDFSVLSRFHYEFGSYYYGVGDVFTL